MTPELGPGSAFRAWVEGELGGEVLWSALAGDGSDKLFYRVRTRWVQDGAGSLVAVDGSGLEPSRQAENMALLRIGRHLAGQGIPVPEIRASRPKRGFFLLEDLGDELLAHRAARLKGEARLDLYRSVLSVLLEMQLSGREGFDPAWCCQTPRYDREMILRYESGYFVHSFVRGYRGVKDLPQGLTAELRELAGRAAQAGPVLFLHRDFQSRNILVQGGRIRVIDFQAGRLGPPGYDLASLLIDPYVGLKKDERDRLFQDYQDLALSCGLFREEELKRDYPFLALHRRLQMLGAFSFLSREKGRPGFERYLSPVLEALKSSLENPPLDGYPVLRSLADGLSMDLASR